MKSIALVRWGHFGDNRESKTHIRKETKNGRYITLCGKEITGGAMHFSNKTNSVNCKLCKKIYNSAH